MHRDRTDGEHGATQGCAVRVTEPDQPTEPAERLHSVLAAALPTLSDRCRDPWVIIGSAAAWLVGADVSVADLDVLTSVRDADALREPWRERQDTQHRPADAGRFRSRFARYRFPGMPVEVMGGLEVAGADGWRALQIDRIVSVSIAGCSVPVPVPCVAEQVRVLQAFGRPKDQARIVALQTLKEPCA